jgi:general secretion pathway protein K
MQGGSALIITLLVISTLTGLTIGFSQDSGVELSLAEYSRDGFKSYQAARSGVFLAMAVLDGEEEKLMDSYREEWAKFGTEKWPVDLPEDIALDGAIVDESGKFNLHSVLDQNGEIHERGAAQLARLLGVLGVEENLLNPVLDWLDKDDIERLDGAENYHYLRLEQPYPCANGPLRSIGQLYLIKGLKQAGRLGEKKDRSLTDFITIYSDGKININTAPVEVLQSLSERMDRNLARAIAEYRTEEDFLGPEDLRKVPGMTEELYNEIKEQLSVKSTAFSIGIHGRCGEAETRLTVFAGRDSGKLKPIYWRVL